MKRVCVCGTTGSGKTTLAKRLAELLDVPLIDLDELHWGPDWTPRPAFRDELDLATGAESWVTAGNYSATRDLTWDRADTIVWLDYPAPIVFWRLISRTMRRIRRRQVLFGGNTESFRNTFMSKDSLLVWFFKTHWSKRSNYEAEFSRLAEEGVQVVHLRRPRQAADWVDAIREI